CAREQAVEVDIGGDERIARDLRVIHLLRLFPHVMIGGAEVGRKYALELGSNRAAHQLRVLIGKNGFLRNVVMLLRRMKRSVSSSMYWSLFLTPANDSPGERLLVSLKTPPSSTGTLANFTPARRSMSGITRSAR